MNVGSWRASTMEREEKRVEVGGDHVSLVQQITD
jgi:hypothetical protein